MSDTADLGDEQQCHRCVPPPSARITSAENAAELELSSHRQAQAATHPQATLVSIECKYSVVGKPAEVHTY